MPKSSAAGVDHGPVFERVGEFEGYVVNFVEFRPDLDATPLLKGCTDDRCQCPHWGYVLKGRIRVKYADRDEILSAGDAYYLTPGHTTVFDEDTELVEFSPKGEYQKTMEVAMNNMAAMQQA